MNPLNNKTLWSAIADAYIAIGFAVLAKRYANLSKYMYREAVQEIRESNVSPNAKVFSRKANS